MYNYVLQNGLKARIWINEFSMLNSGNKDEILIEKATTVRANSKSVVVELFIPRGHNNYALLGMDFLSDEEQRVKVKLNINNQESRMYKDSIALSIDTVTWGIEEEYKQGISNSVNNFLEAKSLPSGIINYKVSAHGEIGSSQDMFETVSNILLSILVHDLVDEDIALTILKNCLNIK